MAAQPLRWRLLTELAGSDYGVRELTERVGEPQDLVPTTCVCSTPMGWLPRDPTSISRELVPEPQRRGMCRTGQPNPLAPPPVQLIVRDTTPSASKDACTSVPGSRSTAAVHEPASTIWPAARPVP
jgi:hypothetical protein